MSDHPRDEDELQALLAGESALSRRYHESSDEQPPAQVDAAILAASRWAVGAKQRDVGSRHTHSRRTGATWRRSSFMRWSVPLATAALVVVAATLTLTIQRDPEIDRLYDKYDEPSRDMREDSGVTVAGKSEVVSSGAPVRESVLASPQLPAPPGASAPLQVPASPSTQAKEKAYRKDELRSNAARKRSDESRRELAANKSEERDAPAPVTAKIEANVAGERKVIAIEQVARQTEIVVEEVADVATPAEAFSGSDDAFSGNEPADVAIVGAVSADMSNDEFAIAGASTTPGSLDAIEAEELMKSTIETSPGRQQSSMQLPESEPVVMQRFADQDASARLAEDEPVRDPAVWIEDIQKLLAEYKREEAIASLEKFRLDYPDYELPEGFQSLLPSATE